MSTQSLVNTISQVLQANWSLSSPAVSDILWETTRVDSATFLKGGKNFAVCCYNPANPTQVTPLSRECWQNQERVIIDVYVKVSSSTPAAAADTRESIKNALYTILKAQEFNMGPSDVYVERETNKIEAADLVRLTLLVSAISFTIQSS